MDDERAPRVLPATLPYATEGPPIPGVLRTEPEDFRVEEIPAYLPAGEGEHLFVHFEKTDLTTGEATKRLARALGANARDAGYAGMKDRRAVTTQWASFHGADAAALEASAPDGIRILEVSRHRNKLRTGHLKGNRFSCSSAGRRPKRPATPPRASPDSRNAVYRRSSASSASAAAERTSTSRGGGSSREVGRRASASSASST